MADTTRIPIDLRSPAISHLQGNSFYNVHALTTATPDFDLGVYEFLKDVDGDWFGVVNIPNTIGATPAAKIILIILANATSGATTLRVDLRTVANDGQTVDVAMDTTVANQDITVPGTAFMTKEVSFTVPTSGNDFPIVAKDQLMVRIEHEGADGDDTLAVNTLLLEAYLEIDLS